MKAISTIFAAAYCAASLPNNQEGVLAPGDSKSQELKELLALDSYNVTSSDAEQNRMHAVCDMEYRLSKSHGIAGKDLGISNLLVTPAAPQFPWNPFTMPLAAVRAHIALLKQEETYLVAQSEAFEGKSSTASTTSSASTAIDVTECKWIATGATAVSASDVSQSNVATDSLQCRFTTSGVVQADQHMYVTICLGAAIGGTAEQITPPAINAADQVATAWGAGATPFADESGTTAAGAKAADGTTFLGTTVAVTGAQTGAASDSKVSGLTFGVAAANAVVFANVASGHAALVEEICTTGHGAIHLKYVFSSGMAKQTKGVVVFGAGANFDVTSRPAAKVQMELTAGTATGAGLTAAITGKDSASTAVGAAR